MAATGLIHVQQVVDEYQRLAHVQELVLRNQQYSARGVDIMHDDDWLLCQGIAVVYGIRSPLTIVVSLSDDQSVNLDTCVAWESILDRHALSHEGVDLDIVLGIRRVYI
jgi:hypothetical protein